MNSRRFPPPWSLEELNEACFVVTDSAGQKLAYVYFEDEPGRPSHVPGRRTARKVLMSCSSANTDMLTPHDQKSRVIE